MRNVPRASESGMLRWGERTSPAVKVMLFQASEEKSEPTWETHKATKSPKAVAALRPAAMGVTPRGDQKSLKLACTAEAFQPRKSVTTIRPSSAAILLDVKTFWTMRPYSRPWLLVQVRKTMTAMPSSWAVESERA